MRWLYLRLHSEDITARGFEWNPKPEPTPHPRQPPESLLQTWDKRGPPERAAAWTLTKPSGFSARAASPLPAPRNREGNRAQTPSELRRHNTRARGGRLPRSTLGPPRERPSVPERNLRHPPAPNRRPQALLGGALGQHNRPQSLADWQAHRAEGPSQTDPSQPRLARPRTPAPWGRLPIGAPHDSVLLHGRGCVRVPLSKTNVRTSVYVVCDQMRGIRQCIQVRRRGMFKTWTLSK